MEDCVKRNLIRHRTVALTLAIGMLLGVFAMPHSVRAQQPDFPYQALVVTDGAKVCSGPGDMHYATEELSAGTVVEVYRHDPGGWCAIRPTPDSFSLVPQAAVIIVSKHVGEVTEDGLQAWVGTSLGPVENPLWQIKLKSGEQVELLGEISWPESNGESTSWYQIAPPNGEFRWVHLDDIKLPTKQVPSEFDNENTIAQTMVGGQSPSARLHPAENEGWRPAKHPHPGDAKPDSNVQLASGTQQIDTIANSTSSPLANSYNAFDERANLNGFVSPSVNPQQFTNQQRLAPQIRSEFDRGQRPDRFASSDSAFGGIGVGQAQSLREIQPLGTMQLSPRLRQLDMRLSAEVIKQDYNKWQLQDVGIDVQQVINAPADLPERVAAERLLGKVQNFRKIQENSRQADRANLNPGLGPAFQGQVGTGVGSNQDKAEDIYDAQGWLNELVRNRGNIDSTFVLQDENGQITHHVQPAPGLNLNRYLRSKVGIIGPRGFNQQLNLDHVVAERIIVLQKPKR